MASHSKADVLAMISREGVVPVFYNADIEITTEVARRVVAGGIHTIEFTRRGDGAVRVFAGLIAWAPSC